MAPRPIANSFFWALGSVLPNSTDAEMYDKFGVKTLSFAFAEGFQNYHQGTDTRGALDLRSLEHHGSYALAIAKHFANVDLRSLAALQGDDVFFDVFGSFVIRYSILTARVLGAAMALLLAFACASVVRKKEASLGGIFAASGVFLGFALGAAVVGSLIEQLVCWGWSAWSPYVRAGALTGSISVLVLSAFVRVFDAQRRRSEDAAALGPIVVLAFFAVISLAWAPGASLVFFWPATFAMLAWFTARSPKGGAVAFLWLVPVVIIAAQVIETGMAVIGGDGIALPLVWACFVFGCAAPALLPVSWRARRVSAGLAIAGAVLVSIVSVAGRLGPAPPVGNAVTYAVEADGKSAFWLSPDANNDEWKRQFLGNSPARARLPAFDCQASTLYAVAPPAEIAAPIVELVSDVENQGARALTLRVRSRRHARAIVIREVSGAHFSSFTFDGAGAVPMVRFSSETDEKLLRLVAGINHDGKWSATLLAVPEEGSLLRLVTESGRALDFRAVDCSTGLAVVPADLRPRDAAWTVGYPGDETWVSGVPLVLSALVP